MGDACSQYPRLHEVCDKSARSGHGSGDRTATHHGFICLYRGGGHLGNVVIYGEAIWDPVALMGKMGGMTVVIALFVLAVATLTTNLAANVVAPANGFSNLNPTKISFKMGGYITAGVGLAIFPGNYSKVPVAISLPG